MDPTPFLDNNVPAGFFVSAEFTEIFLDPSKQDGSTETLTASNLDTTVRVLLSEINPEQELCDIHTALCPLVSARLQLLCSLVHHKLVL